MWLPPCARPGRLWIGKDARRKVLDKHSRDLNRIVEFLTHNELNRPRKLPTSTRWALFLHEIRIHRRRIFR